MCDDLVGSRKRQLESDGTHDLQRACPSTLSRDQIEQFYAGLARAELNREPGREKLKWWSESGGELRFQCSFKRPSIEAVDEVVRRLSGEDGANGARPSAADLPVDPLSAILSEVASSRHRLPSIQRLTSIDSDVQLGIDLESLVHRISVDMEDRFGRRPSMEELAAGISIFSASGAHDLQQSLANRDPSQSWCEERLDHVVQQLGSNINRESTAQWCRTRDTGPAVNRTVITAGSMDLDEDCEDRRRSSFGKAVEINEDEDLAWLRSSSNAAVQAIRQHHQTVSTDGDCEPTSAERFNALPSSSWQLQTLHTVVQGLGNAPSAKSTIKAEWKADGL